MTVGRERAHADFIGHGQGLAMVMLGLPRIGWVALRHYFTEEVERPP
ncbi:MAG TPA: hypothetical protein VK066_02790 [Chloroflexota bacterium]|nr:hypothetical protein [Chloroflexota bacterium]